MSKEQRRAAQISLEDLVEAALRGTQRALGAQTTVKSGQLTSEFAASPAHLPGHIIIGIIFDPQDFNRANVAD